MTVAQAITLCDQLRKEFDSSSPQASKTFEKLKIKLAELNLLIPISNDPKELLLVRESLEIGALLATRSQNIDEFERYITHLKIFYREYRNKIPESPRMYMLLGLNLLRLLAQVRISDFHTELEAIGSENLKNIYIDHPVSIEQALMEGSYNKVWRSRSDIPAKEYGVFMDILAGTIRSEIAKCSEKAYASLPVSDAITLLYFKNESEVLAFANERGWNVDLKKKKNQAGMMRAINVLKTGDPSVLKLEQIPKPSISQTQLLIKNKFSGFGKFPNLRVNFIDTYHRTGLYKLPLPFVPGREGSGIVDEIGTHVQGIEVGDRVAYMNGSTYAEYTAINPDFCIKLPDQVSFETGAAVLIQGLTAMTLVRMVHKLEPNQTVLIHAAAGGTGLVLVQLSKIIGAKVVGVTSSAEKAKLAFEAGADYVINYTQEDIVTRVMEITNNQGVDCVYDGVGKSTFDASLACCKTLASMVSFGNASGKVDDIDIMKLVPKVVRLTRPSLFSLIKSRADFLPLATELFELLNQGKLKINVSKIYPLSESQNSHIDLEGQKTTGKVLLDIEK